MTQRGHVGVRLAALAGPIVIAAVAGLLRDLLANTSAALILVLAVVAVATAGDRVAGVLAALSAAAAFDFFLTSPYYQLTIVDRDDVETAVLLLAIGIAVTEMSQWGRRQRSLSSRREGYLNGVAHAARMAADGSASDDLVTTVERMVTDVLDLDETRYETADGHRTESTDRPRLLHDGTIRLRGRIVDVAREGLPTMDVIELPAGRDGASGRFLLTSASRVRRPTHEQLLVAVTLAEQVTVPTASPRRTGSTSTDPQGGPQDSHPA